MIKIISMDFDGTLLTSDKKISDRTKKCLLKYKDNSYIIIGVTARNLYSVEHVIDVSLFDYIILNNGSDIYHVKEDKIENVNSIDKTTAENIYDLYKNKAYQIDICTPYKYLIKAQTKGENLPILEYIDGFNDVDVSISRMNLFFEDEKTLQDNSKELEKAFNNINTVKMIDTDKKNSKIWLSINPKNVNKLSTLKKICTDLKYSIKNAIFFGDGENDLVLIENAGIGVAMGNALDTVKEKAKYTTLSNDKDGIVEFLENNNI